MTRWTSICTVVLCGALAGCGSKDSPSGGNGAASSVEERAQRRFDEIEKKLDGLKRDVDAATLAQRAVMRLEQELEALSKRVTMAVDDVARAQTQADRAAAKARLEAVRAEYDQVLARVQAARATLSAIAKPASAP